MEPKMTRNCSMFKWLRRRKLDPLVESDARALIERFGGSAYLEARLRQHDDDARVMATDRPDIGRRSRTLLGGFNRGASDRPTLPARIAAGGSARGDPLPIGGRGKSSNR